MKKILSVIALIMALSLTMACFASCDLFKKEETVTVSWYQGSNLLKEEKIVKGSKLSSWTPKVEGKTFTGWYAEASLTQAFDFDKAIEADTDIFAAFKSDEYVEDTNAYYLCGTGAGDMGKSAWDQANETALAMTKEDVAGANVYTITIKMYAGDRFQILHGGTWDGQVGIGYMVGAEYCDGINDYDKTEYKAEDKKVAQVKNEAGEVVFTGSDEYNKGFEVWNIILAPGMDGVYKFTYTTYPASPAYNTITYELVEKIDGLEKTHDMHFIGTFNNWSESYEDGELTLTESEDKSSWVGFITITEEHYADWTADENGEIYAAMKVFNTVDGQYYGITADNILLKAGTYAVKYNVADNSVAVEECDYYIVGTLVDAEGNTVNYAVKDGVSPKLVAGENGSYSVDFEAYDVSANPAYSWMGDQGKTDANGVAAIISIKVVYGASLGIKDWYSAEGGDNWYLSAGTYTVTLADGAVTVTPVA